MSRHLMARFRREGVHDWAEPVPYDTRNGINGKFDKPHGWQQHPPLDEGEFFDEDHPYYREGGEDEWDRIPESFKDTPEFSWHPHWGETHVAYNIVPVFDDWNAPSVSWRVTHWGSHLGHEEPSFMKDHKVWYSAFLPDEEKRRRGVPPGISDPEAEKASPQPNFPGGRFATPEEARDAAEAHFARHYGRGYQHWWQTEQPRGGSPTDFDDFNYGDIFGGRS